MSEPKVDHAGKAAELLATLAGGDFPEESGPGMARGAQAHALLAIVEELRRIADITHHGHSIKVCHQIGCKEPYP